LFNKNILDYSHLDNSKIKNSYDNKIDYSILVKRELSNYFFQSYSKNKLFFVTSSARSSLNLIIQSLNFNKNAEIIVLGHTCSEVPNVIISNNLKPIYIDINIDSLCFTLSDLKKKISSNTRAVIIQHHLGVFNYDPQLISFLKEKSIFIIEDCALSLGSKYKNIKSGTIGDVSIFSFGKSKTFNAYLGGVILVNNKDFLKNILYLHDRMPRLGFFKSIILKLFFQLENFTYNSKFCKTLIYPLGILKIIAIIFNIDYHLSHTKFQINVQGYDYILPNYFNFLIYSNIVDLDSKVSEKLLNLKSIIKIIEDHNLEPYLHKLYFNRNLSICTNRLLFLNQSNFKVILKSLKLQNNTLNKNFYNKPIDGKNYKSSNYSIGECPNSEWLCQNMLQLPF
jgi:dTDP-4-amino-4,6-dideoxygalactose transaminase